MNTERINVSAISSVIVGDNPELTLTELSLACHVEEAKIVALVEEGIIQPRRPHVLPWQFSAKMLPRVAQALRLQRDLELNAAGVALALDLLAEIEGLRKRLKRLSPDNRRDL